MSDPSMFTHAISSCSTSALAAQSAGVVAA